MKLWLSDYELIAKRTGLSRRGYLLKMQTENFAAGYADIFPWPEYGDPDFYSIPQLLKENKLPALLSQSFNFANLDGFAREKNESLNLGNRLKNHYLMTEINENSLTEVQRALDLGFEKIKMKICRKPEIEIKLIKSLVEKIDKEKWLRLDCNGRGSRDFFNSLQPFKDCVEFIEDPFQDPFLWEELSWPWAFDQPPFMSNRVVCDWQIIKPAKQKFVNSNQRKIIFTNYLDHPVGIAHAFYRASQWGPQKTEYGLLSSSIYEETPFDRTITKIGPWCSFERGEGIGFQELFDQQNWIEIL